MAMEFTRADLASENATWALYHRWSARSAVRVASDKARRFGIFKDNLLRALNDSTPGINGFGDLTDEELAEVYNCAIPVLLDDDHATRNIVPVTPKPSVIHIPHTIDWRYTNIENNIPPAVSSIKDQGASCGSCWAFAAVVGMHAIKTRTTAISLSEQQMIDCDTTSKGCRYGWARDALTYCPIEMNVSFLTF